MTKNSVLKLSETLHQKSEADSQQIQNLQQQQLEKLVKRLSDTLERELNTTQNDIAVEITRLSQLTEQSAKRLKQQQITLLDEMQNRQDELIQVLDSSTKAAVRSLRWSWLSATVPSLLVLAVILSASWGLIHFWTNEAISLRAEVIQNQNTLNTLPTGLEFFRENETQYLIMQNEPIVDVYKTKSGNWVIKFNK